MNCFIFFYSQNWVTKLDANYNETWEAMMTGSDVYLFNVEYDSVNDLIYVTGRGTGINYNPLGETYTLANPESIGAFFASYNAQGIMQSVHLFALQCPFLLPVCVHLLQPILD